MEADLDLIGKFHGHIGPYAVLGYRMGALANRELGEKGFGKSAVVYTGIKPPISCLIDGIQLASGCTLGKGNISVEDKGEAMALFKNKEGRSMTISLDQGLQDRIHESFKTHGEHALCDWIWQATDEELFIIEKE